MLQREEIRPLELNKVNKVMRIVVVGIYVVYPAKENQDSNSACAANEKSKSSSQMKLG